MNWKEKIKIGMTLLKEGYTENDSLGSCSENINMDWKEKIKVGMTLLRDGCNENDAWGSCADCPFRKYCDIIEEATKGEIVPAFFTEGE